jgi:mannose-6-phosphate isomerase-like protein (cupin superfamily)
MKLIVLGLMLGSLAFAASAQVDIYSAKDLQAMKGKLAPKGSAFEELKRYGNHYTMLAYRDATGSSELHEHEADVLVVEEGEATLVTGGEMVAAKTQKPGELRGTSIKGGERHSLGPGDVIHIPAGVPHQLLVASGKPFTYFVVKVTGQ